MLENTEVEENIKDNESLDRIEKFVSENQDRFDALKKSAQTRESEKKVVLYDANAEQRVPVFTSDDEDDSDPIILIFAPLTDERYIRYANESKLKLVDDGKAIAQSKAKPLGMLWIDLVTRVENIVWEGGNQPENWQDAFDLLQFKIPTMNRYLVCDAYEESNTRNGKKVFGVSNERVINVDLYFNGKVVTTKHFLQKSNFEFAKELEKSQKMPIANKTKGLKEMGDYALPNSVEGKAALYDRMKTKPAEGFVDGIVPIRVKEEIVNYIAQAVIEQKK